MNGVEVKNKAVLIAAGVGCILLYWIWSWSRHSSDGLGVSEVRHFHTWRTKEFVDIPQDVFDRATTVKVIERHISFDYDGEQKTLFLHQTDPPVWKSHIPLILLHGAGDSSLIWRDKVATLKLGAAMGYRVIAVDLPGYGKSAPTKVVNNGKFLNEFLRNQRLDKPIIVSPSMSGNYALPYLMGSGPDPASCSSRVRGFIPIAPVGTHKYKDAEYYRCEVPTMIVYGSKDTNLGLISLSHLRNMPNSEHLEMEGKGHACYIEDPDQWHRLLYNFLLAVEREQD